MRRLSPVDPAQQDLGIYMDIAMAPQPLDLLGLMAQGHLMTVETQDEGLTRSQALKMNKREVPYYFDPLASNTSKELRCGSMFFGKNPICHAHNKPVRIHCEAGSVSARFVFETRAKLGELSKVCSQIVLKCLYLARIGRLDIQ